MREILVPFTDAIHSGHRKTQKGLGQQKLITQEFLQLLVPQSSAADDSTELCSGNISALAKAVMLALGNTLWSSR